VIEPVRDVTQRKRSDPACRQLDRQRHPIEAMADGAHQADVGLGHPEPRSGARGPCPEQPYRRACGRPFPRVVGTGHWQRGQRKDRLHRECRGSACSPPARAARHWRSRQFPRGCGRRAAGARSCRESAVPCAAPARRRRCRPGAPRFGVHAERVGDRLGHQLCGCERRELDEPGPPGIPAGERAGDLHGQPALPDAGRAHQGHQPVAVEQLGELAALPMPAYELAERAGQRRS